MSKYLDKDFFKFLLGFASIVLLSLTAILVAQIYKDNSKAQTASVVQGVNP